MTSPRPPVLLMLAVLPLLALGACRKPLVPPRAPQGTDPAAGIAWFHGSVEQALAAARRDKRPVLLYWGARWCPYCRTLKATVFKRPDFIAKTRSFVPVYLDGDDPGAQRWGSKFGVEGYPTLIVLDPQGHELLRLGAGRALPQYAAALDAALEDVQPASRLLTAASAGQALTRAQCRRLAYESWELQQQPESDDAGLADALSAAAAHCADDQDAERARLQVYAAFFSAESEQHALATGWPPGPALARHIEQVQQILQQPMLAAASADVLQLLDQSFFRAVRDRGPRTAAALRDAYDAAMQSAASDPRYAAADQLDFLDARLRALTALGDGKAAARALTEARTRIEAALVAERDPYARAGLVNAALNIYEDAGDYADAYQIAKAEIPRSANPYYFEADLGQIAEQLGHRREAVQLLARAYQDSKGAATRFEWGEMYLSGLLRMEPREDMLIRQAGIEVLGELDGPGRIYERAELELASLDRQLRAWNKAARGAHAPVLAALRARMQQICAGIPTKQPARTSCEAFLQPSSA